MKIPEFRNFIAGRFIYIMGIRMTGTVIGWWMYQLTNSKLALGLVGLSEVIPALSLALYAGHQIDLSEKRKLLLSCVSFYSLCILGLTYLSSQHAAASMHHITIAGMICGIIAITGIIRAFSGPTFSAMISQVVPRPMLANAAAISSAGWLTASIIGHAAGGIAGLAMAPVAMYLQKSRIELIVATVACETIGLPVAVTLFLMATMEPGKERTRLIVVLCLTPTLLIVAVVGLVQLSTMFLAFGAVGYEVLQGNFSSLLVMALVWGQGIYWAWMFFPTRCPGCGSFWLTRLTPHPASRAEPWSDRFECRECGACSSRTRSWRQRGRPTLDAVPSTRPDLPLDGKHDS